MLKLVSYRLETGVAGNLWSCPKEVNPLVLYDGEQKIAVESIHGNQA